MTESSSSGFDLNKLAFADKVLGGSGLVFLISTFLDWFNVKFEGGLGLGTSFPGGSGWDVGFLWGRLPFLIVLGMLIWVGIRTFAPQVKLPPEVPALYLVGGGLVAALVTIKLLIGEGRGESDIVSINRSFGLLLATVAALGFGFGAFLKFTDVGGKLDEVQSQLKQVGTQVTGAAKSAVDTAKTAVDTAKETTKNPDYPGDRPPPPPPPSQPL